MLSSGCHVLSLLAAFLLLLDTGVSAKNPPLPPISISVDASEAPRKIFHAHLTIPAGPGPLTLYYPKWLPGEHMPSGPINELAGLKFTAGGQTLPWRRDLVDMYAIHVVVPQGATALDVALDYLSPIEREGGFSGGPSATAQMAVISWNQLLLYPKGWTADELTYTASLRLPPGWKFGGALPVASQAGDEVRFSPVSLYTLVDSPVILGAYFRVVPLDPGQNPPHELDIAADSAAALDAGPDVLQHYKNLVQQAFALFHSRHYRDYHFLMSLSGHVAHFGLEHHESNDSRVGERGLVDDDERKLGAELWAHEYAHSWNGKYRRPADLTTPDYQQPMLTDLLWVYEGLTSYLGNTLAARSGLWTPDQYRDALALIAAELDQGRPGRTWRNLQDTADAAPVLYGAPSQWESWRRPTDFYDEDVLNWLWVDVIIRQQTQGRKSLDDFCRLFYGPASTPPMVKTYTFDDVVNALNQVAPYDWRGFWSERLTSNSPRAPLGGVEGSGWRVVYSEVQSEMLKAREQVDKVVEAAYSIGLRLHDDGTIVDTIHDSPAAAAGIGPGMKLVAVNGKRFTADVLHDALRAGKNSSTPLQLLVENADYYKTYDLNYHGGERYPHLERDSSKPDLLDMIINPVAAP